MRLATHGLDPLEDERGRNSEAQERYLARVSGTQGETPDEVLLDWFQEQPGIADSWAWLDLSAFSWAKTDFKTDKLPAGEVFRGGKGQLKRLEANIHWERQWVWKQICEAGTWHVPPILFETSALDGAPDWINTPLHLAEGYHRLAAVHRAMSKNITVADLHTFWIARPAEIVAKDPDVA